MYQYITPFLWEEYSHKLTEKICKPKNVGYLSPEENIPGEMRVISGEAGEIFDGNHLVLTLLVDEHDGIISDAKFQAFGETPLIAAAEILCDLVILKNVRQASRISLELITSSVEGFPEASHNHVHLALEALQSALSQTFDIDVADEYLETPLDFSHLQVGEYPDWEGLNQETRVALIQSVITHDILPYVELDEGGVKIKTLIDLNLTIEYEGNCTSCFASTGSTLTAIQQILRAKVHPALTVTPLLGI